MKYLTILPFLLITAVLWAQPIDHKRMKRDIEVAENILAALIEDASTNTFQGFRVEGTYLEGYGLLFSIQNKFGFVNLATSPTVIWDGNRTIRGRAEARARGRAEARSPRSDDRDADQNAIGYSLYSDTTQQLDQEKLRELAEVFLTDYGYLLTQLPENEKICIKYNKGSKSSFFGAQNVIALSLGDEDRKSTPPGFTMIVGKKDVEDHRKGKINRQALISRIEYTEHEAGSSEEDRELVLLNSIFNRAYQRDLSEGFFMRGSGNMERIPGLGVLFSYSFSTGSKGEGIFLNNGEFRFYFPESDKARALERDLRRQRAENKNEDDEELDDEKDEPDFDEFLEGFKANIIEYGSTVRNLNGDEVLSFELSFPSCRDCDDRPEKVKITARQSLLERYRTGGIELEDAMEELQVTTN
jgi:hypothetical protein